MSAAGWIIIGAVVALVLHSLDKLYRMAQEDKRIAEQIKARRIQEEAEAELRRQAELLKARLKEMEVRRDRELLEKADREARALIRRVMSLPNPSNKKGE